MALKYQYKSKDEVPAEHASLYVERDGAFVLDVEGVVARGRLDEFRENNIRLTNELKRFDGIDAEKAKELLQKQAELEEHNLIKSGDLGKILENKLAPLRADLERERNEKQRLQGQLESFTLNQALQAAGAKAGLRPSAVPDLLARAQGVFKVVNGQVASNEPGVTLDVWLEVLKTEATHLFEQNSGGGAAGNGSGGAGLANGKKNPFCRKTWNLTEQSKITRENPRLAAQLRSEAGR